jgi:drug/metabolite transporter (DMT)-like permease|tara:strand:+ start:2655 stop:3572 length:918 start_codon:yes stop_codon:yes gene_type:complete
MLSKQLTATLFLVLASIIWGTAFVAQTTGMDFIGPLTFINIRFVIGALLMLPLALKESNVILGLSDHKKKKLYVIIFLTGLSLFIGSSLQQYALQFTKVSNAAFLTILYVPFVPIISRFFLGKKVHWSIWVSVSICLVGSYYLTTGNSFEAQSADILVALCAVFFAVHTILIDEYLDIVNAPYSLAFYQFGICFLMSLPLMFIFEDPSISGVYQEIWQLLYVGIMSTGFAYTFQIIGQRHVKPSTAVITLSLEGVFAALAAWIIIAQILSFVQIIGCTLIIIGVLIAQLIPLVNQEAANQRYHDN